MLSKIIVYTQFIYIVIIMIDLHESYVRLRNSHHISSLEYFTLLYFLRNLVIIKRFLMQSQLSFKAILLFLHIHYRHKILTILAASGNCLLNITDLVIAPHNHFFTFLAVQHFNIYDEYYFQSSFILVYLVATVLFSLIVLLK